MFEDIRIVALDINGTLIGGQYQHWTHIFEEELGLIKRANGPPLQWYAVQTGKITFEDMVDMTYIVEESATLRDDAVEIYMTHLKQRDGCIDLLDYLSKKYELIVCSDTSGVTKVIAECLGLNEYFSKSFYSIDVGWMKSDREYWLHVFSQYPEYKPHQFVMIGDNPSRDIVWPNRLGMGTILIPTTELLSPHTLTISDDKDAPTYQVTHLCEIKKIL